MRPARIIAAVVAAAAVAATGSYLALSTASHPSATAAPVGSTPATTHPSGNGSERTHSTATTGPSGQLTPGRCAASALRGSVQGSDGAAGHIWYRIRLGNASTRSCSLRGIPDVRLLGAEGQPVTAPSVPGGPAGSPVLLRPGQAARFSFSEPNACGRFVTGSRLRVTLPQGRGSLSVPLGAETRFGTCGSVGVQALEAVTAPTTPTTARFDRIADPQVAADRLVAAWIGGDRAAAARLTTSRSVDARLFSERPPGKRPAVLPCRLVDPGQYLCSYTLGQLDELDIWVTGGASVGYGVSGVEFVD
jgi:Protein of unknown function (DUF4232)